MNDISPMIARSIIEHVASTGQPPEYGLEYFTCGLEPYLSVLETDYLGSYVKDGGSSFKLVVGVYGGGKTHFMWCVRDLGWKHNFATTYVSLNASDCPFHRLDDVYRAIVKGLTPPLSRDELMSGYERGIASFMRIWYQETLQQLQDEGYEGESLREELIKASGPMEGLESLSFARAVSAAFRALADDREEAFGDICQWLTGEGYDRKRHLPHGILQRIDKSTAFPMIRSVLRWVRGIGYSGLVILLDEAERIPSMASKQSELLLNNLRQLIDECGHVHFQGALILYAVPDEAFLNGRTQTYEALRQRVSTVLDLGLNPFGVKIELENMTPDPTAFLKELGDRLASVYQVAMGPLDSSAVNEAVADLADEAVEERFGDTGYKRLFVQRLVPALNALRSRTV